MAVRPSTSTASPALPRSLPPNLVRRHPTVHSSLTIIQDTQNRRHSLQPTPSHAPSLLQPPPPRASLPASLSAEGRTTLTVPSPFSSQSPSLTTTSTGSKPIRSESRRSSVSASTDSRKSSGGSASPLKTKLAQKTKFQTVRVRILPLLFSSTLWAGFF